MPEPRDTPRRRGGRPSRRSPGRPLRRSRRDAPILAAAVLLGGAVVAASLVPAGLAAALQQTHAERGLYDLLVRALPGTDDVDDDSTAAPSAPPVVVDGTEVRFEPNDLLGAGRPRLTLDDLAAIREVDGIDVAAPITRALAEIVDYGDRQSRFAVPVAVGDPDLPPEAFRVTVRLVDDDGTGPRQLLERELTVVIDRADRPLERVLPPEAYGEGAMCEVDGETVPMDSPGTEYCRTTVDSPVTVLGDVSSGSSSGLGRRIGDWIVFDLFYTGTGGGSTAIVDPTAEAALLGEKADFLSALADLDDEGVADFQSLEPWLEAHAPDDAGLAEFLTSLRRSAAWMAGYLLTGDSTAEPVDDPPSMADSRALLETDEQRRQFDRGFGGEFLPVAVARDAGRGVEAALDIASLGPVDRLAADPMSWGPPPYDVPQLGGAAVPAGELVTRLGGALIRTTGPSLRWPVGGEAGGDQVVPTGDDQPWYVFSSGQLTTLSLPAPKPDDDPTRPVSAVAATDYSLQPDASVSASRVFGRYQQLLDSNQGEFPATFLLPVPAEALLVDADVPLGAYGDGTTTLVRDADGDDVDPVELIPSDRGSDLADDATRAVLSLSAVAAAAPTDELIDAVRVRVAAAGTNAEAANAIARVAADLEAAGYDVLAVSGARTVPTELQIDQWSGGASATGSPLGTVVQDWTLIDRAGQSAVAPLPLAAAIAGVLAASAVFAAVAIGGPRARIRRRREAEVLVALGARPRAARLRLARGGLVAVGIVLVAVQVAALRAAPAVPITAVGGAALAIAAVAVAVAAVRSTRGLVAMPDATPAPADDLAFPEPLPDATAGQADVAVFAAPIPDGTAGHVGRPAAATPIPDATAEQADRPASGALADPHAAYRRPVS